MIRWRIFIALERACGALDHPEWLCRHMCELWTWADPDGTRMFPEDND